jgi:hypothetical protein
MRGAADKRIGMALLMSMALSVLLGKETVL